VNRQQQIYAGCGAVIVGAWLLHQAFEGAGKPRPFWARFLPG
jgi:hypothetical protein